MTEQSEEQEKQDEEELAEFDTELGVGVDAQKERQEQVALEGVDSGKSHDPNPEANYEDDDSQKDSIPTGIQPELEPELEPEKSNDEKTKRKQEILTELGFTFYDNAEKGLKYSMHIYYDGANVKLGETFKPNNQHFWWAFKKDSEQDKNTMLDSTTIAKIPIVHLYNDILNDVAIIPTKTLIGHIHKRVGKALVIEFESPEMYEEKGASFGEGAVKIDADGHFVPKSFSVATSKQSAKMEVPRDIRLPDYDTEMGSAPKTGKSNHSNGKTSTMKPSNCAEEEEAERARFVARMQWAMHETVRISNEEVVGKIESQGLTGFIKDITLALFREARLKEEVQQIAKTMDKWGER